MGEFERNGKCKLISKTVRQFPAHFRASEKANLQKASDWWVKRAKIVENDVANPRSVQGHQVGVTRRVNTKAAPGRGPKRAEWVEFLHFELLEEFERLKAARVQLDTRLLLTLAKKILHDSSHEYNAEYADPKDGKKITEKLTMKWAHTFMERFNIVHRAVSGKGAVSPAKREQIEREVAFHLGVLKRAFDDNTLDENLVENIDETHFLINMSNGRTLGFAGDKDTRVMDVVSGGEGMTMMVRITGGAGATIAPPFMVFKSKTRSYPLRNCQDNIPGVSYRTSPKAFFDRALFAEYFKEHRAQLRIGTSQGQRTVYLDNYSGHNETPQLSAALGVARAKLVFLPPNSTHLIQPADSFIIAKIKEYWTAKWNEKKMEIIRENGYQDKIRSDGSWSGMLAQPGRRFFLKLAADSVRAVNSQRDKNGLTYARKAMIQCGLSKDVDGVWKVSQLRQELQNICRKYAANFNGEPVVIGTAGSSSHQALTGSSSSSSSG